MPIEYDLIRVFDHPLMLDHLLASAIDRFGGQPVGEYRLSVRWRTSASEPERSDTLTIRWDLSALSERLPDIAQRLQNSRERVRDEKTKTESAAILVAVAVLEHVEPGCQFTMQSDTGTGHDYYLNEQLDEMIEIAGRGTSEQGIDALFEEKRLRSDRSPALRKRWVSVSVFSKRPRNRTEGLHP